ncbi:MAG: PAS domain S-box protein [Ancylobacter novellus]|uniref:PAS domain S-box protein n=1 Tax=Ancylobacter novellus TaxID=921 RepID=A0A2W5K936_ANCNO|nr:MAG: PAS domain S-box protein [Ancylobacter novellus]
MPSRLRPIILTFGYLLAAGLTVWLTRFSGGVAFVWIASAILTSYLVLRPRGEWSAALLGCGAASAVATASFGLGPAAAAPLAALNVLEAVLAAVLLSRWVKHPGEFASIGEVARFMAAVGMVPPVVTAPFAAAAASWVTGTPFAANVLNWTAAHALGALTVMPLALLVGRGEFRDWRRSADRRAIIEAAALVGAMALVTIAVFSQTRLPLLFVTLLPALFATFRFGRLGAATCMALLIAIGGPLTLQGSGPLMLIDGSAGFRAQFFQLFVAVAFLTVLPAAAELRHRKGLFSALSDSEARYRLLAENTTDLIVLSSLDTTRRYVSPASKALLGYEPAELVGTKPLDFVHPDDRENYRALLEALTDGRIAKAVTRSRYRRKDGSWIWLDVSFSLTRDEETGAFDGYVASLRDVTERRDAEEALRLSEERLSLALESGSDGFWDWDLETGEVQFSERWFATLGYDPGEARGDIASVAALFHADDVERARRLMIAHFKGVTPTFQCEYRLRRKDGDYVWALSRGKVVSRSVSGKALRIVGTHIDITQRKEAELQVEHLAYHDALTGLPNRALFSEHLRLTAARAAAKGRPFALLACDLDRFKAVNDSRGHATGDVVLQTVANRLRSIIRNDEFAARLGGDEFAIILPDVANANEAGEVAQRVIDTIGQPIDIDGQSAIVGVSVGVALGMGDPADQIFRNADLALYDAKAEGRSAYRHFEAGMDAAFTARNALEIDLREAVQEQAFTLRYQPIVNLSSGRVCGFEALLRWRNPRWGWISPADFVPLAEESGLIVPIGEWTLMQACAEATRWPSDVTVAVNISAIHFQQASLELSVRAALDASGLAPERLELEITETVLMQNTTLAVSSLMRLRALGIRIALDDFGTGYSSLSYLRRFPFNKIKIDRSFIVEIGDPEVAAIVRAIVGLAERSGASITAEGVETECQLDRVRQEGCTEAQGFHFSEALPSEEVGRFFTRDGLTVFDDRRRAVP